MTTQRYCVLGHQLSRMSTRGTYEHSVTKLKIRTWLKTEFLLCKKCNRVYTVDNKNKKTILIYK